MEQVVLAHVSDVHFGNRPDTHRTHGLPRQESHSWSLCNQLPSAMIELHQHFNLARSDKIHMLVTGDLTRTGDRKKRSQALWGTTWNEFETGHNYFRSQWPNPQGPDIATEDLTFPPYVDYASPAVIPGNHDHWDGALVRHFSFTEEVFSEGWLAQTPWDPPRVIESSTQRFRVELFAVDSTSGIWEDADGKPLRTWNQNARGRIANDEIRRLEAQLSDSRKNEDPAVQPCVRVLLCHHPPELNVDSGLSTVVGFKKLASESRRVIKRLARNYRITAILTGHTHQLRIADHTVGLKPKRLLREFRSSNTLQGPEKKAQNGFWSHRIFLREDKLWWQALPWAWQGVHFMRGNDYQEDRPNMPAVPLWFPID